MHEGGTILIRNKDELIHWGYKPELAYYRQLTTSSKTNSGVGRLPRFCIFV